jgi:glyoxylase-like metal-dependent hydrolase (beta-lactamase superfamily II)
MLLDHIVVGAIATNCWIFPTAESITTEAGECAVFDPGADPKIIISRLKRHNLYPRYILLTHGHFDHIAALPALVAAFTDGEKSPVIAIHPADEEYLGPNAKEAHRRSFAVAAGDAEYVDALWETDMPSPTVLLKNNSVIGPFQVIHLPGHTPGSVGFYHKNERILFSGDTLFQGDCGRTDLPGGNTEDLRQSLKKLFKMDPQITVYPGHGGLTTIGAEAGRYSGIFNGI